MPRLSSHSKTMHILEKGDVLNLEVNSVNDSDKIQWWYGKRKLCTGNICEIKTSRWKIGNHKIVTLVSNPSGSSSVIFLIKVNEATREAEVFKPERIELITEQKPVDEQISADKSYAYSLRRTGYSWNDDKLNLLRTKPRVLDWSEKLKSSGGSIQFGQEAQDEHFLLPGSEAQLLRMQDRRVIKLGYGTLRSRQLAQQGKTLWTVIVGDWLQLDGDSQGDFSVSYDKKKPDSAVIQIYSGRLKAIKLSGRESGTVDEQGLLPGTRVEIERGSTKLKAKILDRKKTRKIFRRTTKELLGEDYNKKPRSIAHDLTGLDPSLAYRHAQEAINARNYTVALWALSKTSELSRNSARWFRMMGEATGGLNLAKISISYLEKSLALLESGQVAFLIGLRYFENNNWKKAKSWFDKASKMVGLESHGLLHYYSAVISFRGKDYPTADESFNLALRYVADEQILRSILAFQEVIPVYKSWGASGNLGFTLDSNLFQTSDKENLSFQDDIVGLSGFGYLAGANAWKYFFQSKTFGLGVSYDVSRLGWIKKSLHSVDRIDQKFISDVYWGFVNRLHIRTFLQTQIVGSERALDGLVMDINFKSHKFFLKPYVGVLLGVHKDPIPGRVDIIDPLSGDLQGSASDRSSRILGGKLGFRLWEKPLQGLGMELLSQSRLFTNTLVSTEDSQESGVKLGYRLRAFGDHRFLAELKYTQTSFSKSSNSRSDQTLKSNLSYLFDLDFDGDFNLTVSYDDRKSNEATQAYSKYIVSTGMNLNL